MKNMEEFVIVLEKKAFIPGEIINGYLTVTLIKPTDILSIKVSTAGEARGRWLQLWKEKNGFVTDENEIFNTLELEQFYFSELMLFGEENDINTYTHKNGRYQYKFQFRLPRNLPETFRCPSERDLGCAKYYIKATLTRENKADITIKKPFAVNHIIYCNSNGMAIPPGLDEKQSLYHCFGKGHMKIECSLMKAFYEQTEPLILSNYLENCTKTTSVTPFARLMRRVNHGKKEFVTTLHEVTDEPLPPNHWNRWEDGSFPIPLVGPTINSNDEISVNYFVRIGAKRKYGSDFFVDLPVIIGTVAYEENYSHASQPSMMYSEKDVFQNKFSEPDEDFDERYNGLILERIE